MTQRPLAVGQSPDLPDVLLHMTGRRGLTSSGVPSAILAMYPWDRLAHILAERKLRYSFPFGATWPVASFTQTTRRALAEIELYQPTGIAFNKQAVWDAGGGPVHYVRGDRWETWRLSSLPDPLKSMGVRYWPGQEAKPAEGDPDHLGVRSEWVHEREWRLPRPADGDQGWDFPREAVAFLVLPGEPIRDKMLATLGALEGDIAWIERLPVAFFDYGTRLFTGCEDLWR